MNSTFSFSRYGGTVAAGVWTLAWAYTATHAIKYCMTRGTALAAFNLIVPIAITLFGVWMAFRTFPRKGSRSLNTPNASSPEPWHRRVFGTLALSVWCAVALVWNLCIFHIAIQAATQGQALIMVITIPFSIIGGFLLLMLFTAIGMFLDFLFHIKNKTD